MLFYLIQHNPQITDQIAIVVVFFYSTHAYLVFTMFWISIRITTEDKHAVCAAVQCS